MERILEIDGQFDSEFLNEINKVFERFENPFKEFDTEKKRLSQLKNRGLYNDPEIIVVDQIPDSMIPEFTIN